MRHIRDIVKGFRARVEGLEKRVDGKGGGGGGGRSSHGHGGGHGRR